jgi:hypothetical protein
MLTAPQAFAAHAGASTPSRFVSFAAFRAQLNASTYASVREETAVAATPAAFAEMRAYVQKLYAGVDVRDSFLSNGSYFDCVTVGSQPSVRALGIKTIASAPRSLAGHAGARASALWTTDGTNAAGHTVSCAAGTVPMERVNLSQVAKYATVRDYLSRGHNRPDVDTSTYRYAHAFQVVNNHGATSVISVWNPKVPVGPGGDDHSLSQQWMSGGSGANLQTAEAGWTKDPNFSTKKPIFFTYFTADDYNQTGCYNLTCAAAFVQTNNSVALGGVVKPCCSKPTVDDKFTQQWFLTNGAWWLNINGTYIGYFPLSVYNGGQMSVNATEVDFGGEVNGSVLTANWPPMGSGQPASAGAGKAAYQSSIDYIGLNNTFALAQLTPSATSTCYSIAYTGPHKSTPAMFYFGGKGGAHNAC